MRLKKRVQQLEDRIVQCERRLFPKTSSIIPSYTVPSKLKKSKGNCKICGNPLPSSRTIYCSKECAEKNHKVYDNKWHREHYKKLRKQGKKSWIPSKKEIKMFQKSKMTAAQWKKYFGLQTYTGVYKKLGQLAMYKN